LAHGGDEIVFGKGRGRAPDAGPWLENVTGVGEEEKGNENAASDENERARVQVLRTRRVQRKGWEALGWVATSWRPAGA
jgi:hypothetical protein